MGAYMAAVALSGTPELALPAGTASKLDVERFTCGDCHLLAWEIRRRAGWPMLCFTAASRRGPYDHAFVLLPDGRALDILGVWSTDELAESWGWDPGQHAAFELKDVCGWWGEDESYPGSSARARILAPCLIDFAAQALQGCGAALPSA